MKGQKYREVRDHCPYTGEFRDHCYYRGEYRGFGHSICNFKYSVPKEIPIVFLIGSNYHYHFIIKELAEEFKKLFTCLGV